MSSKGSLACHTYCGTGHPFIIVISEEGTREERSNPLCNRRGQIDIIFAANQKAIKIKNKLYACRERSLPILDKIYSQYDYVMQFSTCNVLPLTCMYLLTHAIKYK